MADSKTPGGQTPPGQGAKRPATPSGRRAPLTRQERRAVGRRAEDARLAAAGTGSARTPAWKSPMVLMTAGAVAVGLLVVVLASGILTAKPTQSGLTLPITSATADLVDPANPRALGRPDAPVTVEVWSDFQCPFCAQFATATEPAFIEQYVKTGKARLVYRDLVVIDPPSAGTRGESHQAAAAARCAGDQGKFWPYHDYLLENQRDENRGRFTAAFFTSIADALALDRGKFDACMADGAAAKMADIQADGAQGKAIGVASTPTIVVNGKLQAPPGAAAPGGAIDFAQLAKTVDALLPAATPGAGASGQPTAVPTPSP